MRAQKLSNGYILRLEKGELLISSIVEFVRQNHIQSGWFQAIGGLQRATLGFYDLTAQAYRYQEFDELMELVSCQGDISQKDDQPHVHTHGALSKDDFQAVGGHIKEATVAATVEVYILPFDKTITRSLDPAVGLPLLDL